MGKAEWLFFDVGSTLVDETECYKQRFSKIAEVSGASAEEVEAFALNLYRQNKRGDLGAANEFDVVIPKWHSELEVLYKDTKELLETLSKKYKIGIIANQYPGTADRMEAFGIGQYIDLVIASAEEGVAKPSKRIFEIALERAGCEAENAFMIGDRIDNDILPAKAIGMRTIWIRQGFGGMWKITNDYELPTFIADDLLEIITILEDDENSKSLLETTLNTRDLGGRLCESGERTHFNRIYRSDRQGWPSENDFEFLKKNGVTTIIDMRDENDVKLKPSGFMNVEGFTYYNFPVEEGSKVPESIEAVPGSYINIACSPAMKDIFTTIAEAETGVMYNCAAGKDRTGVVSAILLMLCGVKEEEITDDYMLSKVYNKARFKLVEIHHPEIDINIVIPRESYIQDFMKLFLHKFGSVEGYLESMGISAELQAKLKAKLMK